MMSRVAVCAMVQQSMLGDIEWSATVMGCVVFPATKYKQVTFLTRAEEQIRRLPMVS